MARNYKICKRDDCINEKNGALSHSDFPIGKGKYVSHTCKLCTNKYFRERREKRVAFPLGPGVCHNRSKCANVNQGSLTAKDFGLTATRPAKKSKTCLVCMDARKRNEFDVEGIVNSSLIQQFICGRIGNARVPHL